MARGKPLHTRGGIVSHEEIKALLPCFFDIRLRCVSEITNITLTSLFRMRAKGQKAEQWPFNVIKDGTHPDLNWRTIRDLRGKAILSASPAMQRLLFQVERRASQVRASYLVRSQREAIEASSFFPPFPADFDQAQPPTPYQPRAPPPTPESQRILINPDARVRLIKPMQYMSTEEAHTAVANMIDLPIYTVTTILRVSVHTLNDARAHLGLKEWPYYRICKGVYSMTREEVTERRGVLVETLHPDSMLRTVLSQAAAKALQQATCPNVFFDEDAREEPEASPPPSGSKDEAQSPEPAPSWPTMCIEELRDWFGILVDSPPPQPRPEKWVEDELKAANPIWVDDDCKPNPWATYEGGGGAWDRFSPVSPETQAYWDKLIDLSPRPLA